MSDRVAVFNQGKIEQIGTPAEIYEHPASRLRRRLRRHLQPAGRAGRRGDHRRARSRSRSGRRRSALRAAGHHRARRRHVADGRIDSVLYLGASTRYDVALDGGGELTVIEQNRESAGRDDLRQQGAAGEAVPGRSTPYPAHRRGKSA